MCKILEIPSNPITLLSGIPTVSEPFQTGPSLVSQRKDTDRNRKSHSGFYFWTRAHELGLNIKRQIYYLRVPWIDLIDEWKKRVQNCGGKRVRNRAGSGSWWGWTGNVDWDQLRAVLLNDLVPESPPSLPMNISAHSKTCIGREEFCWFSSWKYNRVHQF